MIKRETHEYFKSLVMAAPEGISLSQIHSKVHRTVTRLQLRTSLDGLYMRGEISRERVQHFNRKETRYYPFNGKPPVTRTHNKYKANESDMLSMEDFLPGRKYAPYIDLR